MLAYFEELLSGKSPREIAAEFELDANWSLLYQKHLEQVGVIKRRARNQAKVLVSAPVGFGPGSAYLKREMHNLLTSVVTNVVNAERTEKGHFAILKSLSLSEQDYSGFIEGLKRLIDHYSAISERQVAVSNASDWQIAIASGKATQPMLRNIPRIEK